MANILNKEGFLHQAKNSMRGVGIIDTTLRDGLQAPGVTLSTDQRFRLAELISESGVDEIELGCPAIGLEECEFIRTFVESNPKSRISVWCRAHADDIHAALKCGLRAIHVSVPVSDYQLAVFNHNDDWVVSALKHWLPIVIDEFEFVSLGFMDASRASADHCTSLASLAQDYGVDRVRIADTVGVWNPMQAAESISSLKQKLPNLMIGVHMHNDLGMATANSVAAAMAGADSIDVTINGVGERAGNAALEQVVTAIHKSTLIRTSVDLSMLTKLCYVFADYSDVSVTDDAPVVGSRVFTHESGIHVRGVMRDPRAFEPFNPEEVGHSTRRIVLGTHSGRAGLCHVLENQGISPRKELIGEVLAAVRFEAKKTKEVSNQRASELYRIIENKTTCLSAPREMCVA